MLMKKGQKNARVSNLNKGKVKGVGFFESIPLKVAGWKDGKHGLPRENDGHWVSPHIEREIRSYDEFSSRMWGQLQIEEEEAYSRLEDIMNSVVDIKTQLDNAELKLDKAIASESLFDTSRKKGESKLTE